MLYLLCDYLGFTAPERAFIELIYQIENTHLTARREALTKKLEALRAKHLSSESHLTAATGETPVEDLTEYYMDPDLQLIHIFLTVPKYSREPDLIRGALGLSQSVFSRSLALLLKLNLVTLEKNGYRVTQGKFHLPTNSPVSEAYKNLMRLRTLERLRTVDRKNAYNFSVVFSAGPKEQMAIHEEF